MGKDACVDPNKDNCVKDAELYPDRPPRLLVGINRYGDKQEINRELKPRQVDDHPDGDDPVICPAGAGYIGEVLDWIAKGFAPSEIELAWRTDAGKDGKVSKAEPSDNDEVWEIWWAKIVAEMFLQNAYSMPENVAAFPPSLFKAQGGWTPPPLRPDQKVPDPAPLRRYQPQTYIFQRLQLEYVPGLQWGKDAERPKAPREKNTDPAYSLATQCQQLTTYILISRGFLVERDMACCGTTAGVGSGGCEMFNAETKSPLPEHEGGRWLQIDVHKEFVGADLMETAIDKLKLTPGSIYIFDPLKGANPAIQKTGSHIWPVLRIDAANKRFQNFEGNARLPSPPPDEIYDTLPPPTWANPAQPTSAFVAGDEHTDSRHEGPWLTKVNGPSTTSGLGIAPKAPDLEGAVQHMMRARPVGLARLVIQRRKLETPPGRKEPEVQFTPVYISSFVRMWGDDALENFAPSRFLLSLRTIPYCEALRAYWYIYAPRAYLAYHMWWEGARNSRTSDLFESALRTEWEEHARIARAEAAAAGRLPGPPPPRRYRLSAADLQCLLVLTHDEFGFARVHWRHVDQVSETLPDKVDGFATDTLVGTRSTDDLMPGLDVRWDGEYFHPSIRPGGRHAPRFFDFEHAWAPEENQC